MSVALKLNPYKAGPGSKIQGPASESVNFGLAFMRSGVVEWVLFWTFIAALAWVPFWYGSNERVAWGINAVLFPGMAMIYELSALARGKGHAVAVKEVWISAALFVAVVLWIIVQNANWTPSSWHHPIWGMAAEVLKKPINGSISVNRDLTVLALMRLVTAASVFWLALQLCRDAMRAKHFMVAIAVIVFGYSAYGITAVALSLSKPIQEPSWTWVPGVVSSTFVNHDHFGAYAGIGLIVVCGLILNRYRTELTTRIGSLRFRIASIVEASAHQGALLIGAALVIFVALLGSSSRGAVLATGIGLLVLFVLMLGGRDRGFAGWGRLLGVSSFLVVVVLLAGAVVWGFGDKFLAQITERGLSDEARRAVYVITLRSIFDAPLLGYGYGTFVDIFPMFRDQSISTEYVWAQAHDSYLEVFQGLGLVFGSALVASVVLLVIRCFRGTIVRREGVMVPAVATGVAFLVGVHALADFSLQIQAVALTFTAILGAGVAQSKSSQLSVNDYIG